MILVKEYLGNESLAYILIAVVSLLFGYLLNKKNENPLTRFENYLEEKHPLIHQFSLIFFPELFLVVAAIALIFYYL